MRFKRLFALISLAFVALAILFCPACMGSTCTGTLNTFVELDGSGNRSVEIVAQDADLQEAGISASDIAEVLARAKPDCFSLVSRQKTGYATVYTFTMEFDNIRELEEKSSQLLGEAVEVVLIKAGTPFVVEFSLSDSSSSKRYFDWALDAIQRAGLVPSDLQGPLLRSYSNRVWLPGQLEWKVVSQSPGWQAMSTHLYPVEKVQVETNVFGSPSRTFTVTVSNETAKQLNQVEEFLSNKTGASVTVSSGEQEDLTDYTFTISEKNLEALKETSEKIFGSGRLTFAEANSRGIGFWKDYLFEDAFDFTSWLGTPLQMSQPLEYSANFKGTRVDSDGQRLPGDQRLVVVSPSGEVYAKTWVRKVNVGSVVGLVLVLGLFASGIAMVVIRRKKAQITDEEHILIPGRSLGMKKSRGVFAFQFLEKLLTNLKKYASVLAERFKRVPWASSKVWVADSVVAGSTTCLFCGLLAQSTDKFCYRCGHEVNNYQRCPTCGQDGVAGDNYCYWCGNKISDETLVQSQSSDEVQLRGEQISETELREE